VTKSLKSLKIYYISFNYTLDVSQRSKGAQQVAGADYDHLKADRRFVQRHNCVSLLRDFDAQDDNHMVVVDSENNFFLMN
jgi:hypothetical protein